MSNALAIWNKISNSIIYSGRKPREPFPVSDEKPPQRPTIEPQRDYVGLRINQLYLRDQRQWFTTIEPAVYASTEFLYGGSMRTDPFVVGPKKEDRLPSGMAIENVGVFGPHPYRGGKLTYTLVLAQIPVKNVARDLLDIIESTGKALDPGAALLTWTKVGGVVLDGFDRLMGLAGVQPLIGIRREHDADADPPLRAGHYAIIDTDEPDPKMFWVEDDKLLHGPTRATAKPYRDADFVLYEITSPKDRRRTDVDRLAFYPLWDRAREAATKLGPAAWDEAKGNMAVLDSALFRSPDLVFEHATFLRGDYLDMLKAMRAKSKELEKLGPGTAQEPFPQVGDILRLP
jgi:hypothetical protein